MIVPVIHPELLMLRGRVPSMEPEPEFFASNFAMVPNRSRAKPCSTPSELLYMPVTAPDSLMAVA